MTPIDKIKEAETLLGQAAQELQEMLVGEKSRKRGAIRDQLHKSLGMLQRGQTYFSQSGQDRVVDQLLNGKRDGVFVDVGAYDGVSGSNSLFFELYRGWSGIMVEPAPTQLRKAVSARKSPVLGYAVGGEAGQSEFLEVTQGYTQMSGFLSSYNAGLLEKVRANPNHKEVVHTLDQKLLSDILDEANLQKIDFLSLDVEGGEIPILSNFPFDRFDIEIWSIENNTKDGQIPEIMRANGYELVEFAGVDDLFRKR